MTGFVYGGFCVWRVLCMAGFVYGGFCARRVLCMAGFVYGGFCHMSADGRPLGSYQLFVGR